MPESESEFPPNVILYVRQELERRTQYKIKLEDCPKYNGNDLYRERKNAEYRENLQHNINRLTQDIIKIVKKHMPSIEIVEGEPELTISNILQVLPPPEKIIVAKVFHGSQ